MKKQIIFVSILFFFSTLMFSQPNGSGTFSSPYYGTISSNTTWYPDTYPDQTVYVTNLTIASGATLTISPGTYYGGLVQFFAGSSLTISSGCTVIINPGIGVTVDEIYNSGTLRLESSSNEAGVASLIHDLYEDTGGGIVETKLYLSGGTTSSGDYKWHYISVPVSNVNVSTFNTLNLAQYIESLVVGADNFPGWVAYDGYQYSTGNTLANSFSILTLGKGYNYYSAEGNTFTFSGVINISNRSAAVTCGSGFPDYQGYNLIGNPFASCLDWDYLIHNYPPAYVDNAIYFTNNGTIASYVSGLGSDGGTGTIPPMQGFFVKANSNSTVSLRASARVHYLDQYRYKKKSTGENYKSSDTISFVRLLLESSDESTDLVVRFNQKATTGFDRTLDAFEFNKEAGDINMWTTIGDVAYSINGLPFPLTTMEIPVEINVKIPGNYKISSNELNKLENYSVTLKDLSLHKTIDLKMYESYEFTAPVGLTKGRFVITVTNTLTTIPKVIGEDEKLSIYSSSGLINVILLSDEFESSHGSITIYDLNGRKVFQQNKIEWGGIGDRKQIISNSIGKGFYLVEVEGNNNTFVRKVYNY